MSQYTVVTALEGEKFHELNDKMVRADGPEFLNHDSVVDRYWARLSEVFPGNQFCLVDEENGTTAGIGKSIPLAFTGGWEELPDGGLDWVLEKGFLDQAAGRTPTLASALDAFWQEVGRQGAPLIEPVAGDAKHSLVTFLWRAVDETQNVAVVSNLSEQMGASEAMARIPATDLWYRTYKLANDTRESYQFTVAGENVTDPFNPHQYVFPDDAESDLHGWVSSVLELPDAPPQFWSKPRLNTPNGQVSLHRIRNRCRDGLWRRPGFSRCQPTHARRVRTTHT